MQSHQKFNYKFEFLLIFLEKYKIPGADCGKSGHNARISGNFLLVFYQVLQCVKFLTKISVKILDFLK